MHLMSGDCESADQLQSNTPGRIPGWKGSPSNESYGAGSIFVDQASTKVHLRLQLSTGAEEAVEAKHRFERMAAEHNVLIRKYHGDNGETPLACLRLLVKLKNNPMIFVE